MNEKKVDVSDEEVKALLGDDFELEEHRRYNVLEDNTVTVEHGAQETMINPYNGGYVMTSRDGGARFTAFNPQPVDPRGKVEKFFDDVLGREPETEDLYGEPANGVYSLGGGKPYIYVSSDEDGSQIQPLRFDPSRGP